MKNREILKVKHITKSFSGVTVLKDVSLTLKKGETRALVGENGAGKSTLNKIICGIYDYDSGEIEYEGRTLPKGNPVKMKELGFFMIPQDLGLMHNLTVMQNILLGREYTKVGLIDLQRSRDICGTILGDIGIDLDLDTPVGELSIDQRQFVAIARVLYANANIIIMDEPSATLSKSEVEDLFRIIRNLKQQNITIIYVSHKIEEIFEIADSITILKDGNLIQTASKEAVTKDEVINKMVGRTLSKIFPEKKVDARKEQIMSLENVSVKDRIHNVSLDIRRGEILGLGGLVGMGQTSLLNTIFGVLKTDSGIISLGNKRIKSMDPAYAISHGIYYVSSDRHSEMLFLCRSVRENISIATIRDYKNLFGLNPDKERVIVNSKINEFNIVVASKEQEVQFLSGGNQQKVVLARWLVNKPKILLLDEPTQGIDVGTKEDIYKVLRELADEGIAIVVVFSDMIELLGMCDRIAVLAEGRLSRIFSREEATEENIVAASCEHPLSTVC